ncbi:MAG TPA: hypothetical protein VII36_06375, partial [Usitatibacter sp.]
RAALVTSSTSPTRVGPPGSGRVATVDFSRAAEVKDTRATGASDGARKVVGVGAGPSSTREGICITGSAPAMRGTANAKIAIKREIIVRFARVKPSLCAKVF